MPTLSPLKLFAPASPQLATAGGSPMGGAPDSMMLASGYDDDDFDAPTGRGDVPPQRPVTRQSGGGSGSGGNGGGRQRSVQFEPEERFWTEYLRIALPIIGLLLMIGVFWYWAQALIDDPGNGDDPVGTTPVATTDLVSDNPSTPEPTSPPATEAATKTTGEGQAPPTNDGKTPSADEKTPATDETTPESGGGDSTSGGDFVEGDKAVINDDDVNLRSEASTAGGQDTVVATLAADTAVTVTGGPEEADGFTWYQITVDETGDEGWVSSDFINAP